MAQSILTVDVEKFRGSCHTLTSRQLVGIIRDIYDAKWNAGEKMPHDKVLDLERKETIVMQNLMQRGYLNKGNYNDYVRMRMSLYKRKYI